MGLLDVLIPPACAGCGRAGTLLCGDCVRRFEPPGRPDDRFVAADPGAVIGDSLVLALCAFAYRGPVRRALAALKYTGAARIAPMLAAAALPALGPLLAITGPATLVPVPVHAQRRRERGYDQADLLAGAIGTRAGLEVDSCLRRTRPTTKQHRLDRAARLANLRGAFGIAPGAAVPPVAIVVDDIITTTATLEACASVLRDAGARSVYGFAVAREV